MASNLLSEESESVDDQVDGTVSGYSDKQIEHFDAKGSCFSDVNPMHIDEECFEKGSEEERSFESGSAEVNDDKDVVQLSSSTSEGEEFEVEIKSDLGIKVYGTEGKMKLSIQEKGIVLINQNSQSEKYTFPFKCIRRIGIRGNNEFLFEVGRTSPLGQGTVYCKTKEANKLRNAFARKMDEHNKIKKN